VSGYVVACYAITAVALASYATWALTRLRAVNRRGSEKQ
jgi:heme exporter protein CcmD